MVAVTDELADIDGERTVVTSALPYIHGVPHLGNVVGSLLPADLYHRYLDLRGHDNIFICGSDEHGTPLELSAIEAGEAPKEHADRQHKQVKTVLEEFDLDFSLYGRTHTEYNRKQTLSMFKELYRNGYIVEKTQELPYCRDCERFLPDRYIEGECPHCGGLARGDQCDEQDCGKLLEPEEVVDPYCTICDGSDIDFRETRNLFLQLSKFEDALRDWLDEDAPIPDNALEEVQNLIDEGLEDRCITRDIDWGFPVPHEELGLDAEVYDDKVLYVWFDAPIGYIGITRQYFDGEGDEARWKEYWLDPDARTIYSIGKDNTIFHSIIFPSMLIGGAEEDSAYNLPDHEFIHQYLLSDDVQFSKSRGTGLSSEEALDLLPADYWRFYLASVIPENHDTRFSWADFESRINGELNDNVGNYVNRVLTLCEKWFDGAVPAPDDPEQFTDVRAELEDLLQDYDAAFEQEKSPKKAAEHALEVARLGDRFLQQQEPWNDDSAREAVLYRCLEIVEAVAVTFHPFTPSASADIWRMLGNDGAVVSGEDRLAALLDGDTGIAPGQALGDRDILFEKVDADALAAEIGDGEEDSDSTDEDGETPEGTVTVDEFGEFDLRVGTIVDAADHPNADRLYVLQVDVGGETLQTCSGLVEHYTAEELQGRQVVVLANLEPAELRGEQSECMVLAADDGDDVVLVGLQDAVADGAEVR